MKTEFFATRTAARNAVEVLNGKFKDFGKDAEPGKRWAVLVDEPEVQNISEPEQAVKNHVQLTESEAAMLARNYGSVNAEQVLTTPNNKRVRVSWRRSLTAVRLTKHLQRLA